MSQRLSENTVRPSCLKNNNETIKRVCRLGSEAVGSLSVLKGGRVTERLSIRLAKVVGRETPNMEMGLAAQTDHVWAS